MKAPMPNDENQQIVNRFASIFQDVIDWPDLGDVRPGVNVSDRIESWQDNYRVPDVAVFLRDGTAVNHGNFWYGGPDFAVEVISVDDKTREKIPFYESVQVRELLLVDRAPWKLEFFRLVSGELRIVGCSTVEGSEGLTSESLPFTFRMVDGPTRPKIEVVHSPAGKTWLI